MSASDYESLSVTEKVEAADEVAEKRTNADHFGLLRDQATYESENGCYHAIGEPTGSIRCDECCGGIALGTECATIKCFARQEDTEEPDVHWEPRIICLNCADNACVDADYKVGLVVHGTLERRRTRPGDPCSAPYVYYTELDENPKVTVITDVEEGNNNCYGCW